MKNVGMRKEWEGNKSRGIPEGCPFHFHASLSLSPLIDPGVQNRVDTARMDVGPGGNCGSLIGTRTQCHHSATEAYPPTGRSSCKGSQFGEAGCVVFVWRMTVS